jgi:hypothetical protein
MAESSTLLAQAIFDLSQILHTRVHLPAAFLGLFV